MSMDCLIEACPIELGGECLFPHPSGALWWPDAGTLIVADLHLEKGSSFARHGSLLPPYDTRETLTRLTRVIDRLAPRRVIALGDSFHDNDAIRRFDAADAARLIGLTQRQEWLWLAGNHDPQPSPEFGGTIIIDALEAGPLILRHAAHGKGAQGEISGHYHPKASISVHGRRVSRRCFIADRQRIIMPAFGCYTGGLDILDPAICRFFSNGFTAYLLGHQRVSPVPSRWFGAVEEDALL